MINFYTLVFCLLYIFDAYAQDLVIQSTTSTRDSGLYEYLLPQYPQRDKLSIQRFKGLGEMNPEELWETTLNPDNRTMLRVQYSKGTKDKSKDDQKMIKVLMGDEVAPRKDFITNNALDVTNLDI